MQDYLFGLLFALAYLFLFDVQDFILVWYSKKGGKDQESIQSSTTPGKKKKVPHLALVW